MIDSDGWGTLKQPSIIQKKGIFRYANILLPVMSWNDLEARIQCGMCIDKLIVLTSTSYQ